MDVRINIRTAALVVKQFFNRHWWIIPTFTIVASAVIIYFCYQYDESLQRTFYP